MILEDYDMICLTGVAGAGKDTIAKALIAADPSWVQYSFARPLKLAMTAMFGWTAEQLEDREFKEAVDPAWGFSPRKAMRLIGTEYGRNMLRPDVWLIAADQFLHDTLKTGKRVVVSDLRFMNEYDWARSRHRTKIVAVIDPAYDYSQKPVHASEVPIDATLCDGVIYNDKALGIDDDYFVKALQL